MDELEPTEANLRIYLQIIARRLPWLVAVTMLSVAVSVAYTSVQKKEYSATAQLLVQPTSGSVPTSGNSQTISPADVATELQLVSSAPVTIQVTKKLGFTPKVSAAEVGQTDLINVTSTARSPVEAAQVANTYATTFVAYQRTNALNALIATEQQLEVQIAALQAQLTPLEAQNPPTVGTTTTISELVGQEAVLKEQLAQLQISGTETPGRVQVASSAITPRSPSSPKPVRDAGIALGIGLLLGLAAAFAAEYFDDKVYTKEEVEQLSGGVPVLAVVPRIKSWKKSDRPMLIAEVDPYSPATEAYRWLRTSLQFAGHGTPLKTILVTSASGAEGKTSTVANLGMIIAKSGERVVVVDCDLRRPRLAGFFGIDETLGFASTLVDNEAVKNTVHPASTTPGLALIGSGPLPPNPGELLGSRKAADTFRLLAESFDIVLIDSPPLLPVADPLVLSQYADAVLMVVMVGLTTRAEVERASELLAQVNARPMGIVLNKATRRSAKASEYGYGYGYKYSHTPHKPEKTSGSNGLRLGGIDRATNQSVIANAGIREERPEAT